MKPNYRKEFSWRAKHPRDFCYDSVQGGYYRQIRTIQEIRRNIGDYTDFRADPHIDVKRGRGRNSSMLDSWNDFPVSRRGKKSWKDFTRHKKQWMVGGDPKPVLPPDRRGWGWLVWFGHEHYDH